MFGVTAFTAIINPPQAAILSVGALGPRAVVRDGEVVSAQHDDGYPRLRPPHPLRRRRRRFLARIRELLEAPAALTL